MTQQSPIERRRIDVLGQVQGVGFRPWVYRVANALGLVGEVRNDSRGACIEVQGEHSALETFLERIERETPPLAEATSVAWRSVAVVAADHSFRIAQSSTDGRGDAQVTVDTAICADCLRELRSRSDRRYGHAFITCTNCGPRYSIVRRIPYDRPNTTMAEFEMCPQCAEEYADPANRRFHAQPIACPQCGPRVRLTDPRGWQIPCRDPIVVAAEMLSAGRILAVKGVGGYHLACRADDESVVQRLRKRKNREAKPLALMVADLKQASRLCQIDAAAEQFLTCPERPIVLLPKRLDVAVAHGVAEGLGTLGLMLPCTPLEYLLFDRKPGPLVMTSGNVSGAPLIHDDWQALRDLGPMVDAFLTHDRAIESRIDDSVVQTHCSGVSVVRRARGYAPRALPLGEGRGNGLSILAVGAELKSAFCLLRHNEAILSPHIGDLTDERTLAHFAASIDRLEALYGFEPQVLACDAHPMYFASEYAKARSRKGRGKLQPLIAIQHHHAHIASCLIDNGRSGPVLGLACDGVGYGEDGSAWGCEMLRADLLCFERIGTLRPLRLPGGDLGARETWRPALAAVWDALGSREVSKLVERGVLRVDRQRSAAALEMLEIGVCCPPVTSLGRWFDAAAHLVGVADGNRYEGEAPMRLEALVDAAEDSAYSFDIQPGRPFCVDLRRLTGEMVRDVLSGEPDTVLATRFHNTIAAFLRAAARRVREEIHIETVALSGGCFANRYLADRLSRMLEADGFEVLRHRRVPCNDGGICLGQAAVAAARLRGNAASAAADAHFSNGGEHVPCDSIEA